MPATSACRSTSTVQKTDPFTTLKAINRSELTKGAKILYSQLRVSAGPKGFVFYRVHRLAEDTNSSISSTKEYLQELRALGLVIPEHRPGRSNVWHVYDPDPAWDGKVPESPTQPVDRPGGSRCADGGSAGPPAPLKNVFQDVHVKRSTFSADEETPVRVPEPEIQDDRNDENVDKSCPQKEKEAPRPASSVEPEVRATLYSPDVSSDDSACAPGAACTPGHPDIQAPNTEKTKETSAVSQDHVPDDHGDHGTRTWVDSLMRVRAPGADARTRNIFDTELLREVLDLTGDHKSKGCWISCVSRLPEEEIRIAMSSLRIAMAESDVYKPGAYLLGVLRARNPEFSFTSKGKKKNHGQDLDGHHDRVPSTAYSGHQIPLKPQRPLTLAPLVEPEPQPSPDELVKGWRFSLQALGIDRTLEVIKRCVSGTNIDPHGLWTDILKLCPSTDQKTLIERFFQCLSTRLKHATRSDNKAE